MAGIIGFALSEIEQHVLIEPIRLFIYSSPIALLISWIALPVVSRWFKWELILDSGMR